MTDYVAAAVAKAELVDTDAVTVALRDAIVRGAYLEDETSLDRDGDVVLVNAQPGAWYVGATFRDGDHVVFVNVTPDGPLGEAAARERFYVNSAKYADDDFGSAEAYDDYMDRMLDAYIEDRLLAK